MANTKKRVLSLLMAAVMMLSALPMNAYAIDWDDLSAIAEIAFGKGKLVCVDENTHHEHGDDCYTKETVDHTHTKEKGCYHEHGPKCADFITLGCSYKTVFGVKIPTCAHGKIAYHCGKTETATEANLECDATTEEVQKQICTRDVVAHTDDCYYNLDDIKAMFNHIKSYKELAETAYQFSACWLGGGECGLSYQLGEIKLNLCEDHFCNVCSRLKGYCDCVEITFTNICNVADNSKTVKVKNGSSVDAKDVPADTFVADYEFLGWFDENNNQFSTETTFTEDTKFTAQYRPLTEVEKFQNIISFIENNFDLGTEIGRILTTLTNGKVNKEYVLENKDTALSTIDMTAMLSGKFTLEQYNELCEMMREGGEYVEMVAEWLWPENAVMMPTIEEILAGVDFEKLSAEIKDMIAEKINAEFNEEWIENNRALADQYIRECLAEVKSITEQQKAAILEQLAQEKAEAVEFVNNIRNEIRSQVAAEIEAAKDAVKTVLADRELGLKLGKLCKAVGLNADKLSNKNALAQAALKTVISTSGIPAEQKNGLLSLLKSGDNGMAQIIAWLFPTYTVNFVVDGATVETDVVEHGAMPNFDGAEPTKAADAQYTYTFGGWDKEFSAVTENVTYTASFDSTVNEYTVTFVNEDGTVLQSGKVAYGETPVYTGATPEKAADVQYTYTFGGWDKEFSAVTENVTYTASFDSTVNEYTVTFVNEDGTVLQSGKVAYGETPVYTGAAPEKEATAQYTYTFNGWTPAVETVTGDATYTATFGTTNNQYTITVMSDGKKLAEKTVDYGAEVSADIAPATSLYKEGYDCIGWKDSEGNEITFPFALTRDMTIEAVWQVKTFTVTWVDADDTVLETDYNVPYGTVATYDSEEPTKAADERYIWTFSNFQDSKFPVTGNVTYRATYVATDRLYTVNFVYGDTVIKTESVKYEAAATAPVATEMPVVKNHKFESWDTDFSKVTGDMTVTAQYERTNYDEKDLKVGIGYGGVSGSDSTAGFINLGNAAKTAGKIYDVKVFESFKNWPKSTIMEGTDYSYYTVKEGFLDKVKWDSITYYNETNNENPTHNDYFQIYKVELVATKGQYHLDNHAKFYHTVTFVVAGNEYKVPVVHGETVALPEDIDLTKEGYTFEGWDKDFSGAVKESMTVEAQYEVELADREVELVAIVDGEAVVIGSTTIKSAALAEIVGEGDVEKYELGEIEQNETITHGGLTYTYRTEAVGIEYTEKKSYDDLYPQNVYNFGDVTGVEIVKTGDDYSYRAVVEMERFHRVTFAKPQGGKRLIYVEHGGKITPYWAEGTEKGDCAAYEVLNYWYNSNGGAKLDFDTFVVTKSVGFSCKTKAKIGDWEVALTATFGDETFNMGTAMLMNSAHAGNYRNNKQNIAYDEIKMVMPEFSGPDLEIGGITYYADTKKADFYTVEFNNLTCLSHKVGNKVKDWSYEFLGEIKLYHTVIFVVDGNFVYTTVEHGTAAALPEGCTARSVSADISNVTETMLVYVK